MTPPNDPRHDLGPTPAIAIPERARGRLGIRLLDPATAAPIADPDRPRDPDEGKGDNGAAGGNGGGAGGDDWPPATPPPPGDREPHETAYVGNHLRIATGGAPLVDVVGVIRGSVASDLPGVEPADVDVRPVGRLPDEWGELWGDLDDDVQASLAAAVVTTLSIRVVVDGVQRPLPDAWPVLQDVRAHFPKLVAGLDHAVTVHGLFDSHPLQGLFDSHPFGANGLFDSHSPDGVVASYAAPGWGGRAPVARPRWTLVDELPEGRRRPVVAIMDTAVTRTHPWLPTKGSDAVIDHDVTTGPPTNDAIGVVEAKDEGTLLDGPLLGGLEPLAGHGTFIAGLIRQACPTARLRSMPLFLVDGTIGESTLADALLLLALRQGRALSPAPQHEEFVDVVDVLSLSLGYYHESSSPTDVIQTATLRLAVDAVRLLGITVVVSAGNDATSRVCIPAAFADGGPLDPPAAPHAPMIAVGAMNPGNRTIALFSNEASWVTAWRRGVALISAFPVVNASLNPGATVLDEDRKLLPRAGLDPDDFTDGFAAWTGTSFAAPLFAGDVACGLRPPTGPTSLDDQLDRATTAIRRAMAADDE